MGNPCCRGRGLGEESTLGRKLHLSLRRKDGSSTGFRLLRTLFSSQLCQLLTTRPLSRTETNITKKRISEAFQQTYHSNDLAATSTIAIVRHRAGGWAKDDLHSNVLRCHRQSKK